MSEEKRAGGRPAGRNYGARFTVYDTPEGIALLKETARRRDMSAVALLRQLVREEAKRLKVKLPKEGSE